MLVCVCSRAPRRVWLIKCVVNCSESETHTHMHDECASFAIVCLLCLKGLRISCWRCALVIPWAAALLRVRGRTRAQDDVHRTTSTQRKTEDPLARNKDVSYRRRKSDCMMNCFENVVACVNSLRLNVFNHERCYSNQPSVIMCGTCERTHMVRVCEMIYIRRS